MPDTMMLDLLVCDTLIRDLKTGKWTLVGIVDRIGGVSMPLGMQELNVFTRIANAPAKGVFGVTVANPNGMVVASRQFPFEGIDTRILFEVGTSLAQVIFTQPGRYSVQVSIDDEVLGERAFYAQRMDGIPSPRMPDRSE